MSKKRFFSADVRWFLLFSIGGLTLTGLVLGGFTEAIKTLVWSVAFFLICILLASMLHLWKRRLQEKEAEAARKAIREGRFDMGRKHADRPWSYATPIFFSIGTKKGMAFREERLDG